MTHDELNNLIREPLLRDRPSAIEVLRSYGWLLIPDVRTDLLSIGAQGVFHSLRPKTNIEADFVTYEILQGRLHWQLVSVAPPSASIVDGSLLSTEFQDSLQQIERWRESVSRHGLAFPLKHTRPAAAGTLISYRIIIGQSHQQTVEEQDAVRQSRRNDLRIRSFDWLLEKPVHYADIEIELLNKISTAHSAELNN